nr:immunoglobulin heavy chain junction region [Mus musculus]NSM05270.1 immunoglobulin heavy chain junction region [Mus musculus]
CARWHWLDYW